MRLDWDSYFLDIAEAVSRRATCPRLSVGTVIVKAKKIISTGYNGSVNGASHCLDIGCKMYEGHCIATIHSEANALIHAEESLYGTTVYTTHAPCLTCFKLLIGAGVWQIFYRYDYKTPDYTIFLENASEYVRKI